MSVLYISYTTDIHKTVGWAAVDRANRQYEAQGITLVQRTQQQHDVQVRIVRKLRWRETSAETPNNYPSRDGTRTASEADGSVFQLKDAETHPREGVTYTIAILTGVISETMSQTEQEQQQNSTVVARA